MKFNTLALNFSFCLVVLFGSVHADEMGHANADASLEGEFAREFRGVWGRALSNLQIFTGSLGGVSADPITNSGDHSRPYMVAGDTFPAFTDAISRSCANQNNKCADAANNPAKAAADLSVEGCQTQESSCIAAGATATQTNFQVLTSSNAEFDFICDS
ncbi:hypothetical protein BCIN_08g02160 [Botrytis cinerea B05.10]|uniref:Secreted protein n=1 Tax=Botryotinia fuckeliana (strain B05.10) TaxID=332648 RepID=A0A384JPK8_BOTFB|nr:hypothetical protein BCIN_08g02160 [Botrytis cinerea B05.10]ATZ52519.1 hypothetical protein BCIN_08g02160 [Botrytis cinerea B05.10]